MKTIYAGLEDSGKSYMLGWVSGKIVERNARWLKITGVPRPLVSNIEYSQWFIDFAGEKGIPIRHWKDLEELIDLRDCDLIIDEVGTYFDSRTFKDLPLEIRLWLAQASKLGVDIWGSAQDFAQVDIAFRRLTNELYWISKITGSPRPSKTRPPVKRIWGICTKRQMDPVGYDEQKKAFNNIGWLPWPFFIRREICTVFDTNKRIPKSAPPPYKHIERRCSLPDCNLEKIVMRHGQKHNIIHV